jgi:predicted GTPase/uncharacterized protein (DUF697 family)
MIFSDEFKVFANTIALPNILITGRSGSGKSTLLNSVFGKELSETGAAFGNLTKSFVRNAAENGIPLTLFDSAGFEIGKEELFLEDIRDFIDDQQKQGPSKQIHLVWYVVNTPLARFEPFERSLIKSFNKRRIPVIVVLSQCDGASDAVRAQMVQILKHTTTDEMTYAVIEVSASPLEVDGEPICQPFGLEELVAETVDRLPETYRHAFVATQIVSIRAKRSTAYAYTTAAAGLCFASGYLPIPFMSALSAYIAEKRLAAKLASVYGYEHKDRVAEALRELLKSIEALAMFASTSVLNLFFFDPLTSTIAGATAAAYVMIVGLAFAATFEEMAALEIDGRTKEGSHGQFVSVFHSKLEAWHKRISLRSTSDLDKFKDAFVRGY